MDPQRFDALIQALPAASRRSVLAGIASGLAALMPLATSNNAAAKQGKKRTRPLRRNAFGCVSVGQACRGDDDNCCSGRCNGPKPKKGAKDTSRCVAHNASTCLSGQTNPFCGGADNVTCLASTGDIGQCLTTTGGAPYCAKEADCFPCQKDSDCVPVCGAPAACFACGARCPQTGGTACAGIGACEF